MRKVIIVGGSKGIGNAILKSVINDYKVINISRTKPEIHHQNLFHHECNILTDKLPEVSDANVLIYCPGSINLKPFDHLKIQDFKDDYEINVLGAVKVIQKYLPKLRESHSPNILLFSTVAAKLGMPFHASIATAKSAVEGLVKSLGAEFAPKIRINAIAPTVTDTDLASKILRSDRMKDAIIEKHPLKRYLKPDEVAAMAQFLISEKASTISGQIFEMDCGIVTFKI